MAISLLAPASGRAKPRSFQIEVAPDHRRELVALTIQRPAGPRLHLLATADAALDLATQLAGAVMRLRGQGDET